jgi:hypothetical protein
LPLRRGTQGRSGYPKPFAHLDFLDEHIDRLFDAIEEQLGPFAAGSRSPRRSPASPSAPPR